MLVLDFERPVVELESQIRDLKEEQTITSLGSKVNILGINRFNRDISKLEKKLQKTIHDIYSDLSPWQKLQIARHKDRPNPVFLMNELFSHHIPLCGDRFYSNDNAIICNMAKFKKSDQSVMIIANNKGSELSEKIANNFGMAMPDGYRKAERAMLLADKFGIPIVTIIDTMGAYPGVDAENRGQSYALAKCQETLLSVKVPVIAIITGEACSGGAIALGCANSVLMAEYAFYTVISPEGCASILWSDAKMAERAANAQKLTAKELLGLKYIDKIIPEPTCGAHRDSLLFADNISKILNETFVEMGAIQDHYSHRINRFLNI